MDNRRALAVATLLAGLAVVGQGQLVAQTIQRALYVSVLNEAGAPVMDLGPSDFIVREDNVAREVLKVAPATDPMQVALLVDNSQAAAQVHPRLSVRRSPSSSAALAGAGEGSIKNDVAIIAIAERPDGPHRLHHQPGQPEEGNRSPLVAAQQRRLPARRYHTKPRKGSRSATPSAR